MWKMAIILLFACVVNAQVMSHVSADTTSESAPEAVEITEDFSTDPKTSRWTDDLSSVTWQSVTEDVDFDGTGTVFYHNTPLNSADYYVKVKCPNPAEYSGILFRYDTSTDLGYVVRWNGGNDYAWRYCNDASCTDIETASETALDVNYFMGIHVSGTGSSTEVELWIWSTDPGNTVGSWGTPDHTFTNNPGANARDSGKYVGLYEGGGASTPTFDDFWAQDE